MLTYKALKYSLKIDGLNTTFQKIYYSLFKFQKFFIFFRNPDRTLPQEIQNDQIINKFSIRNVDLKDLKFIRSKYNNLPSEFYSDIKYGFKTPYMAFMNDEPAAIHWLVRKGEMSRFFDLQIGDIELNYFFVVPKFRGFRLSQGITSVMLSDVYEKGYRRILTAVNINNIAQYKPFIRLGFEPVEILNQSA